MSELGRKLIDAQPLSAHELLEIEGWPEVYARSLPADYVIAMQIRAGTNGDGPMTAFVDEIIYQGLVDKSEKPAFDSLAECREFCARAQPAKVATAYARILRLTNMAPSEEELEGN